MKRTKAGTWEHDFRLNGLQRYHASSGTRKADEASCQREPLYVGWASGRAA